MNSSKSKVIIAIWFCIILSYCVEHILSVFQSGRFCSHSPPWTTQLPWANNPRCEWGTCTVPVAVRGLSSFNGLSRNPSFILSISIWQPWWTSLLPEIESVLKAHMLYHDLRYCRHIAGGFTEFSLFSRGPHFFLWKVQAFLRWQQCLYHKSKRWQPELGIEQVNSSESFFRGCTYPPYLINGKRNELGAFKFVKLGLTGFARLDVYAMPICAQAQIPQLGLKKCATYFIDTVFGKGFWLWKIPFVHSKNDLGVNIAIWQDFWKLDSDPIAKNCHWFFLNQSNRLSLIRESFAKHISIFNSIRSPS